MYIYSPSGLRVTRRGAYFPRPLASGNRSLFWSLKVPGGNRRTLVTSLPVNMCIIMRDYLFVQNQYSLLEIMLFLPIVSIYVIPFLRKPKLHHTLWIVPMWLRLAPSKVHQLSGQWHIHTHNVHLFTSAFYDQIPHATHWSLRQFLTSGCVLLALSQKSRGGFHKELRLVLS